MGEKYDLPFPQSLLNIWNKSLKNLKNFKSITFHGLLETIEKYLAIQFRRIHFGLTSTTEKQNSLHPPRTYKGLNNTMTSNTKIQKPLVHQQAMSIPIIQRGDRDWGRFNARWFPTGEKWFKTERDGYVCKGRGFPLLFILRCLIIVTPLFLRALVNSSTNEKPKKWGNYRSLRCWHFSSRQLLKIP